MAITMELAAHPDGVLEHLDDDTNEDQIASVLFDESEHTYSAGRIWHVIHFILVGDAEAVKNSRASFMLSGGHKVGPSREHGRARVFSNTQCRAILEALIDPKEFENRLAAWPNPDDVAYGDRIVKGSPEPDYASICRELRTFIADAVERGDGVVTARV